MARFIASFLEGLLGVLGGSPEVVTVHGAGEMLLSAVERLTWIRWWGIDEEILVLNETVQLFPV
ncbi:MAG: hypothetical protein HQL72_15170 [Magnetococcales bacterium]|nr:hypothetical protein [Magnetococcales bacterium]